MTSTDTRSIDVAAYSTIRFEFLDDDLLLRVIIDRPDSRLNAVNEALHHDLTRLFVDLMKLRHVRCVILTGSPGAFSAGGDFSWFPELRTSEKLVALRRDAKSMIWNLLDVEVPIVAALGGPAIGLGASIALLCDLILAADNAVIGDPHVKVGLVAGDGGTVIWPMVVGPAKAKEFLLLGDTVSATEAERIGLINRVVPSAELDAAALALARRLAANPPMAVQYTKAAVNKGIRAQMELVFDYAASLELSTFMSEDHAEAVSAVTENRKPNYTGR